MATTCLCGTSFGTVQALHVHAKEAGHLYECHCQKIVGSKEALVNHQRDVPHRRKGGVDTYLDLKEPRTAANKCGLCTHKKPFCDQDARDQHIADKHNACPVCLQVFDIMRDRLRHQKAANHCYCAEHNLAFNNVSELEAHRRADTHISSYECTDCDRSFRSDKALNDHLDSDGHHQVIIAVANRKSANESAATKLAQTEEANLRCEPCKRSFKNMKAFTQHKQSLKHNPLSELKCPLSKECTGTFTSPSALLFHLESGGCKGGMTRNKLNAIVYQHDTDRHITAATHVHQVLDTARSEASRASIAPGSSASNRARSVSMNSSRTGMAGSYAAIPSDRDIDDDVCCVSDVSSFVDADGAVLTPVASTPGSTPNNGEIDYDIRSISDTSSVLNGGGVVLTPSNSTTRTTSTIHTPSASIVSSDGGIILTPPASLTTSAALSDWSFLTTTNFPTPATTSLDGSSVSTVTFDTALNRWPCPSCPQTFRKKHDLTQHMNSVVHAAKVFHCPTDLPGLPSSSRKPTTHFKTLSGLAQHVEAGSCKGGKATLGFIVGIFEKQIEAKMGKSVKLLK